MTYTHATRVLRDESGFTLVELMMVLIVLGILTTTVLFGVGQFQHDAAAARDTLNQRHCYTAKVASRAGFGTESQYGRYLNSSTAC